MAGTDINIARPIGWTGYVSSVPWGGTANNVMGKAKIWPLKDMDADHVAAWSKGGKTEESNCELLCKSHNRAKGNA